jgi:hypothetical protein
VNHRKVSRENHEGEDASCAEPAMHPAPSIFGAVEWMALPPGNSGLCSLAGVDGRVEATIFWERIQPYSYVTVRSEQVRLIRSKIQRTRLVGLLPRMNAASLLSSVDCPYGRRVLLRCSDTPSET